MNPSFDRRKTTSFGLFFSFTIMLASGIILWKFPRISNLGEVAEFGGLGKPAWLSQHIVFGVLFAALSLYHLFGVNRKLFFSYLNRKTNAGGSRCSTELLVTLLSTALIFVGTVLHVTHYSTGENSVNETSGSFAQNGDNRNAAYEQNEEFTERSRHRHFFHDDYDDRGASPQIAERGDAAGGSDEALFTPESRTVSRSPNNGAPDDELHRRRTASCASCH
ncbi:MAG: DUF4405 domain-containing protein [Chlorobaculum sp.]|nr:DUF4405 domain-containing protein [Chlorobaculum sp.]